MKNFYRITNIHSDQTTELEDLLHRLEINKKHLNHAQQIANIGSWEYIIEEDVFYLSDHCLDIFGIDTQEKVSLSTPFEYIHPDDRDDFNEVVQKAINRGMNYTTEVRIYHGKTKQLRYITIQAEAVRLDKKPYKIIGVIRDCTNEKMLENRLNYIANHDDLTSLPNRLSLVNYLNLLSEKNNINFAVLYIEIGRFNNINDSLGYRIADQVLINIATKLQKLIDGKGTVFKFNTDHFFLVFENYRSKQSLYDLKNKIKEELESPLIIEDYRIHPTINIGLSTFTNTKKGANEIIKESSSALFQEKKIKQADHLEYVFKKKEQMIEEMRQAVINGGFELHFQPQINICTGEIISVETLIRWNHKEQGLIPPLQFIPLAEETHIINDITDWVILESIKGLHKWKEQGLMIPISINVSPIRLMKEGLTTYIEEQLSYFNIPPDYIELEITENAFLNNDKNVKYTIKQLRNLGVKIAIDDFGTGYSSFNYIREFDIDTLKIDRVFVQNICNPNKKDAAIVTAVLNLAKGLGIKAIAEGVETESQLQFLKKNECLIAQGFLFSKPIPYEEFVILLEENKRYLVCD